MVNTFVPYSDFVKSAKTLDYRRLGKQRVEAWQILSILTGMTDKSGWKNHPAVLMWKGYERCLCDYGLFMSFTWKTRGYKDNMYGRFSKIYAEMHSAGIPYEKPTWLGNKDFHSSHRSNLIRKDPIYYSKFGWTEDGRQEYIWPVRKLTV
jgi:hypothetical protein